MVVAISKKHGIKCFKKLERSHVKVDVDCPGAWITMHSPSATTGRAVGSSKVPASNHLNVKGRRGEVHVTWDR